MKLITILILLTVTLASASCKRPVVEGTVDSDGPADRATIMPISPPESLPDESAAPGYAKPGEPQTGCVYTPGQDGWCGEMCFQDGKVKTTALVKCQEDCRQRLVDVVRQARAYLGNSRPYLDVGPVEREIRIVGRETLLSEMDMLLQECR